MSVLDRIEVWISRLEKTVMLLSYVTLILLVGAEAVRRVIFQDQFIWGPEIALYAFVWLSWFAMSHNIGNGSHLSFGEFRRRLPERVQFGLAILDDAMWLALGAILSYALAEVLLVNIQMRQVVFGTDIPLALGTTGVLLGWSTAMFRVAATSIRRWGSPVQADRKVQQAAVSVL